LPREKGRGKKGGEAEGAFQSEGSAANYTRKKREKKGEITK